MDPPLSTNLAIHLLQVIVALEKVIKVKQPALGAGGVLVHLDKDAALRLAVQRPHHGLELHLRMRSKVKKNRQAACASGSTRVQKRTAKSISATIALLSATAW